MVGRVKKREKGKREKRVKVAKRGKRIAERINKSG
jgi:hypothetical protein